MEVFGDMRIDDDLKMVLVTRFLSKRAKAWWNNVKRRFANPLTWTDFLREFDKQYYTRFHQVEK